MVGGGAVLIYCTAQAWVWNLLAQHLLRGVHNMALLVAKYCCSHHRPNSMARRAHTYYMLPYIPEVLQLEYNRKEERTVKKIQVTEKSAGISGTCNSGTKRDMWVLFAVFY
jgi:hypothetical protein